MTDPTNPADSDNRPVDLAAAPDGHTASSGGDVPSDAAPPTAPASSHPAPQTAAVTTPGMASPGAHPAVAAAHAAEPSTELGPPAPIESSTGDVYAIADGDPHSLDPKYIPLQRVSRSIGGVIFSGAGFIVVLIVSLANGFSWIRAAISFGIWGFLATMLAIWVFHWPTVRYRHMSYQVDRKGFRFREGVYWQSSVSVPKTRIQHTDVSQGPIERHFGLSTLVVHTAGTQHASVSLDGLRHETSLKIRDFLLAESKAASRAALDARQAEALASDLPADAAPSTTGEDHDG